MATKTSFKQPTFHQLQIEEIIVSEAAKVPGSLEMLAKYGEDVAAFESDYYALVARRQALAAGAASRSVDDLRAEAEEIKLLQEPFEGLLTQWLWARRKVLEHLAPGLAKHADGQDHVWKATRSRVADTFAEFGIDIFVYPMGWAHPTEARKSIETRMDQEIEVMADYASRNRARYAADLCLRHSVPLPSVDSARVTWPEYDGQTREVLKFVGLVAA